MSRITPRRRVALALLTALAISCLHAPAIASTNRVQAMVTTNVDLTQDVVDALAGQAIQVLAVWPQIRAMSLITSETRFAALASDPRVASIERDQEAGVLGDPPTDPSGLVSVTIPDAVSSTEITTWNQDMANTGGPAETGEGVTVAVLDSGLPQNWEDFLPPGSVDLTHATGFGTMGWGDFHSQTPAVRGVGGHIGLFPHGLAVSSIIVGFPSELGPIGGAAPGARILPIRVLNQFNFGWYSWMIAAILYVGDLKGSGAIPGPVVINFSIQGSGASQALTNAIDYAISKGVLFVTIAGNFNPEDIISFPGRLPQCITAGAVGWTKEGLDPQPWFFGDVAEGLASEAYVASFSGREPSWVAPGSLIDVVAPGSYVFGEWNYGPGYSEGREVAFDRTANFIFGTSFAAPHVAGIVARMLEKNPGLTQAGAENYLRSTALYLPPSALPFITPLGEYVLPWDARATGAGLVQGEAAVTATPTPFLNIAAGRPGPGSASASGLSLRVLSPAGRLPVELGWRGAGSAPVSLALFDVQGRLVRRWTTSGETATWDGSRRDGTPAASGVYFLNIQSAAARATTRVVLAR